jgi:A118 family predicted phage portal protein
MFFQKILEWIRRILGMDQNTVKTALRVDVAISQPMATALQTWCLVYANTPAWGSKENGIYSMGIGPAVPSEIARAVTIEMKVEVSGSERADYLAAQIEPIIGKLRQQVEYGCAKGGLIMKPYVSGDQILIDFVQADQFYPVSFDSKQTMTACVFADQKTVGDKYFTRLEYHNMQDMVVDGVASKGCVIKNQAFKSTTKDTLGSQIKLTEVDTWADLEPEATITGIDKPLFAYFKFPSANNIDSTSPLGVSCFARATSGDKCLIQQADEAYSQFLWELDSAQRALYVDVAAFKPDENGKPYLPNKRLYRTLNASGNVGEEELFHDWSPTMREVNYLNGLDAILRKIEFTCGLAYGTLSNPQTIDKTATELKIAQQRSYATITDTQKSLQDALEQLLWAMDTWATIEGLSPEGVYTAVYDFDDSIVVDKDSQFAQDMRLLDRVISPIEFRVRNFGENEATATAAIAKMEAGKPKVDIFNQGA